jgi:hypothetical protein
MNPRISGLVLGLAGIAVLTSPLALAGGGTVVRLQGTASVERKGQQLTVAESTPLYSGDTLSVASQGVAQLRFEDDSVFVIPGSAKFRVEEFKMPSQKGGGKAIYTLVDGGLRTITGKVSKGGEDQYELRTEEATVTVAGSSYSALRCKGKCAGKYKTGFYVKGESGTITVTSTGGKMKLRKGQVCFVSGEGAEPVEVKISPFNDPELAAAFNISADFDTEVHPPRIEPDQSPSP